MASDHLTAPASATLPALLTELADRHGEQPAVLAETGARSFAELAQGAARVRAALRASGIGPGDTVGLLASNVPEWLEAAFGILGVGARVAAFNTWAKAWDLEYLIAHSDARALIAVPQAGSNDLLEQLHALLPEAWSQTPGSWRSERFPGLTQLVVIGPDAPPGAQTWEAFLAAGAGDDALAEIDPDSPAYLVYTSGSTAHPKSVPLVHRGLIENGFQIGERMRLGPRDRVWLTSPLFWSYGCANALMATFTHGAALVLQNGFDAARAVELIERHGCTAGYLLPGIAEALLAYGDRIRRAGTLRTGLMIGRPDELRRVVERLGVRDLCSVYGSTETYGNCCVTPCDAPLEQRVSTCGPPLPGVELRIVDPETREPRTSAEPGEIEVRGYVTPGYLGNPEATAKAITADGWYRTGDLGVLDGDGFLAFRGRATEMIKSSGINVSPAEIERFLITHEEVAEVVVVGAPHPSRDEAPVAFVLPVPGAAPAEDALTAYCKGSIAGYMVPAAVVVVDRFPQTSTGKVARRQLSERAAEAIAARVPGGPRATVG